MTLTPEQQALREAAMAATAGPWELLPVMEGGINHLCPVGPDGFSLLTVVHQGEAPFGAVYSDTDAKFIAAANPAAILALLAQLESATVPSVLRVRDDALEDAACLVKAGCGYNWDQIANAIRALKSEKAE